MSGTSKTPRASRFSSLAQFVLLGLAALPHTRADADDPLPPLRRVYVPADQLQALGERYPELHSMSRDDFEDLVRRARLNGQPSLPQVESGRYLAALDGDRLSGSAELEVRGKPDARSMLRWPASAWAISGGQWNSGAATIGYVGRGELGLVVPPGESHTLTFNWTLSTESTEAGKRFEFRVPPSLWGELTLDLPRGLTPAAPGAVVSGPTNAPRPELQRWLMRWSPADAVQCLLLTHGGSQPLAPLVVYGREMEVDVAEEAAELLARMDLFVAHQPIQQLEFECSPGLKFFGWSGVKVHDWQERDGRVVLDLAEPLQGSAQITVRAVAPGSTDGQWKLPRLEIVEGHWTGGQTRLRPAPGLNLYGPQVTAGRVVSIQDTSGSRPELIVEHTAPNSGFTARVSTEVPEVFAKIHSSIELGPRLAASVAASWQVASGEVATLELRIPPDWSLGDVDVLPAGLLSRWSVGTDGPAGRIATLRLNRPVGAETAISAQLRLIGPALDESSSAAEFAIPRLQPVGVHAAEEILSIEMKPSWSAELTETEELSAISRPSALSPSATERTSALSYRFDGPRAGGKIVVTRRPPELAAKIEVNADVTEEVTQVSYTLDLEIASGPPDWVDVRFGADSRDALSWDLPEGVRAERIDPDSHPATGTETWRVTLPRKAVPRVRLNASWRTSHSERTEIPLPTILQATSTTGQVAATCPVELDLTAELKDLVAGPVPNDTVARTLPRHDVRRQFWRYGTGTPQLAIRVDSRPNLLNAESWIAHTRLRTVLDSDGGAIHTAQYEVHGKAGIEITLQLPSGASVRRAYSNGAPITAADGSAFRLISPSGLEVWQIEVQYVTPDRPLGRWARLAFELPEISIPSLRFTWELNAPANYVALAWTRDLIASPPHATKTGPERLFGTLASDSDEGAFKFWQAQAWRNWWIAQTNPASDPVADQLRLSLDEFVREGLPRDRTWARLIAHLDEFAARRLVIDTIALEAAGLDLNARADLASSTDSLLGLARTSELNLLRTTRGLLLTTREAAAELAASHDGTGLRALSGRQGLAEAIDEATLHDADASGRFSLARGWGGLGEPAVDRPERNDAEPAMSRARWRFESLADPATVSVTLVDDALTAQAATTIVGIAVLLAFVRTTRPSRRGMGGWSLVVAVAFVLALTLPDALAAPAATLAWSLLVVLIFWSRRPPRKSVGLPLSDVRSQLPSTITQVGTAGALLLLALVPWQTTSAELQDNVTPKYSLVFIPYDPAQPEKRREASRVLVPRETYDRLVELTKLAGDNIEPVLIRSSTYAGRVAGDRLDLTIDLEIESLTPDAARVSVPLSGLLIRSAQLDGKPCLLEPGPQGLTVEVSGNAAHKLHIDGVLALDSLTGEGSFALKIPPTPTAGLEIELPPDITFDLEPATASTEWIKETQKQRLRAELGAVDHLIARWRRGPVPPAELRVDAASLFTWKQAASRLEVRANVTAESGRSRKLVFEYDPRLVLERVRAAGMAGYSLRPGERPQVVLEFERPLEKQTLVGLEFLVTEAAGANMVVPEVRVAGAKTGLNLVAVRADGKASLRVVDPKEPAVTTVEDFQGLWGEPVPRSPEMIILQSPANSPAVRIEKKQTDDRPVFRSQAELRVGTTRVDLVTQVICESAAGKSFHHELSLPTGLELRSVRASAGTQWRHVASERLVWFGLHGGDVAPSIELQGWVPSVLDSGPLPVVRPLGDCRLLGELTVWRDRNLKVSVFDEHGMQSTTLNAELRPPAPSVVAESQHEISAPDFAAQLKIERLTPRLAATVAGRILIEQDGAEWISVLDYQVEDGSFEKLEFRIPGTILPPLQIAGEGIYRRDVRREGSDQIWTIQLEEPRWSSYRLVVRARVDRGQGISLSVPTVHPMRVTDVRKYLLVLNATEEKYDIRGVENQLLVPSEGFSKWFSEPIPKSAIGAFELHEPGGIELQRAEAVHTIAPQTALIERHCCWVRPGGRILIESTLLIQARTDAVELLALPESTSVLDMRVDGHAIRPSLNPDGQVQFYLAADDHPHEVQLWWSWDEPGPSDAADNQQVELPRLMNGNHPGVWKVFIPPRRKILSSSAPFTCRSLLEATQARAIAGELERLLESPSSFDSAERAALLLAAEQLFVVATDFVRRSSDAEAEIGLNRPELRRDHDRAAAQLGRLMEQNRELLERTGLTSLRARAEAQSPRLSAANGAAFHSSVQRPSTSPSARPPISRFTLPHQGSPAYFLTESQNLALSLGSSEFKKYELVKNVAAALGGLFAWGVYVWLVRTNRHMLAVAIGLGVIGALWCWKLRVEPVGPSLLLAAVLVALCGLVRRRTSATQPTVGSIQSV